MSSCGLRHMRHKTQNGRSRSAWLLPGQGTTGVKEKCCYLVALAATIAALPLPLQLILKDTTLRGAPISNTEARVIAKWSVAYMAQALSQGSHSANIDLNGK